MQSKGVIKLLAILLAIACIYQPLLLTESEKRGEKGGRVCRESFESDSLRQAAEIYYLDSVQNRPVYDLGFISFTYKRGQGEGDQLGSRPEGRYECHARGAGGGRAESPGR